jgi:hypothetical protein
MQMALRPEGSSLDNIRSRGLWTPAVAKSPRLASKQRPQVRAKLVSATVYLLPDQLALIKQHCSATNRRISDLISEAVDEYLSKPR